MRNLAGLAILTMSVVLAGGQARLRRMTQVIPFAWPSSREAASGTIAATIRWTNAGHRLPAAQPNVTLTLLRWCDGVAPAWLSSPILRRAVVAGRFHHNSGSSRYWLAHSARFDLLAA
jgi:hypothetical protein